MTNKLYLKELWFPNFGNDDSKKNFRIVYFISFEVDKVDDKEKPIKDADGNNVKQTLTLLSEKPKTKQFWQWRKEGNLYLAPKNKSADPVELDLSRLRTNDYGFQADNYRIERVPGTIVSVRLFIYDVDDKSFADYLRIILKAVGADAIKLAGGAVGLPGAVVDLIAKGADVFFGDGKTTGDKIEENDPEKRGKDKLLFSGFAEHDPSVADITVEGRKIWKGNKEGTFRVKIGFE